MRVRTRKKPLAEINVVPYIDVMLVLLIIFMITAPMLTQGVDIDLPKAQSQAIDSKDEEPIILSVSKNGLLYLNISNQPEKPMTDEQIGIRVAAELRLAKASGNKRLVLVRGDSKVDYGKVVGAMALLQQAGATSVGLVTEPSHEINLAKKLQPSTHARSL
jgi:biopolymer transport protein TolR